MKLLSNRVGLVATSVFASLMAIGVFVRPEAQAQTTMPAGGQPADATIVEPVALPTAPQASADDLKLEAFKAIRAGDFGRGSQLLAQADETAKDPVTDRMATWTKSFEGQEQVFVGERRKEFEKAEADVHLLLDHKMDDYAADEASRAYSLSDDKDGFVKEQWIADLIKESAGIADTAENSEQWLKAMRVYSDLETLEPSKPEWKDKLKLAYRGARLLMQYAPDELKKLQDNDVKYRQAADDVLHPATRPTTEPVASDATTQPAVASATTQPDDDFRVDWRDEVKGIQYDMLWDALVYADKQYYRDVNYQTLMIGGLGGVRALVTTHGLQTTFPHLAEDANRKAFLDAIDSATAEAKVAKDDDGEELLSISLHKLMDLNKKTVQLPDEVFITEFADGEFAQLDPFSVMEWPYQLEEFQKSFMGEFGGVGIQIQLDPQGNILVTTPLEDTPAYRAGIKAGDIIAQINGKNAKGVSLDRAVKIITGVPGTTVTLTIRTSDGTMKPYTLKRETIKVGSIKGYLRKPSGGWDYFIDPDQKIGYIRLTNFTSNTSDDLEKAMGELKDGGAKAMILDLRADPGGLLDQAARVVNKFVPDGLIVSTKADRETPNPPTVINTGPKTAPRDGVSNLPLVVLVNQYSASASEIVSGALKDHQRAILVGERTFGKGSVQMIYQLDDKKAYLKLTTSHYYLPNGKCIHREENSTTWGVDPDITIPLTPEQMGVALVARQELDVLHDPDYKAPPATQPVEKKDLLSADPQLSAALLILRLEVSGAQL